MRPGNTIASFETAVELGVDMIELDVLGLPGREPVIAHDLEDTERPGVLALDECLDAFTRPPLDAVEIDCDLKTIDAGEALVRGLESRGLLVRAMVSGLDVPGLERMRALSAELRIGWTYPRYRRSWMESPWSAPAVGAGLVLLRRRLPGRVARQAERVGLNAVWPQWRLVTRRLVEVAERSGVEVCAWTVDDAGAIRALRDLGVHGVCTNDPRLFEGLD